jgi:dipeptidyl aminopeptidase/acylaminoacyl peptidase
VVFAVVGDGLHVVPLSGDTPPRRLTSGGEDTSPTFSRDGRTVYFQVQSPGARPRIEAVPLAGGAARVVRERADSPSTLPGADRLAFVALGDAGDEGVPMVLDLVTGREQPLSTQLSHGQHPMIRFSPDGRRAAVLDGWTALVELDMKSGKVLSRYDAGNEEVAGLTYAGDELVLAHRIWGGNLWIADDPFP